MRITRHRGLISTNIHFFISWFITYTSRTKLSLNAKANTAYVQTLVHATQTPPLNGCSEELLGPESFSTCNRKQMSRSQIRCKTGISSWRCA